jgi:acylphosphatase
MRVARRYVITGRVQGVGFRFFTEEAALHEGIDAEGDADAVDRFERAVRHGPPAARVDDVDVTENVPSGARGFSTR